MSVCCACTGDAHSFHGFVKFRKQRAAAQRLINRIDAAQFVRNRIHHCRKRLMRLALIQHTKTSFPRWKCGLSRPSSYDHPADVFLAQTAHTGIPWSRRPKPMKGSVSMQNEWWMRPALQKSEAVLLPALPRRMGTTRLLNRSSGVSTSNNAFVPVGGDWHSAAKPSMELSTYVRPRGSMAGRSVLRAAGICANRYIHHPVHRRW